MTSMAPSLRLLSAIREFPAQAWDRLCPAGHPFVCHAFLNALEQSGSIRPALGWTPAHLGLWSGGQLCAAMPAYRKMNSHGEFVFDWHWADAYARSGRDYYPKLLAAVPYSPVPGPRFLFDPQLIDAVAAKTALLAGLRARVEDQGWSGAHVNFHRDDERIDDPDWIERLDWQYHWQNRGYRDFADFLDTLSSKKRKNIRQERAALTKAGWRFLRKTGAQIERADLDAMYGFYRSTFQRKGNTPALTPDFFVRLHALLPDKLLLIFAFHQDRLRAGAFFLQTAERLYGRYWGADTDVPGLHFETCYYQGIEHAIDLGIQVFEPGAQGEHKLARGFVPVATWSSHFLVDPGMRAAIKAHVARETAAQLRFGASLRLQSPYREIPS